MNAFFFKSNGFFKLLFSVALSCLLNEIYLHLCVILTIIVFTGSPDNISRGGAVVARQAHNLEVIGSNPFPATICTICRNQTRFRFFIKKHCKFLAEQCKRKNLILLSRFVKILLRIMEQ